MPRLFEGRRATGIVVYDDARDHQGNESGRCQIDEQVPIIVRVAPASLSRMWPISDGRDPFCCHNEGEDAKRSVDNQSVFLRQLRHSPSRRVAAACGAKGNPSPGIEPPSSRSSLRESPIVPSSLSGEPFGVQRRGRFLRR